jgi:acetyl-CoA acetyltransferase
MDGYALRSQKAAGAAAERGVFKDEIVPVEVAQGRKTVRVETDDHPRPETTLEGLAGLRPAFGKDGFVTAGNASGVVGGAVALGHPLGATGMRLLLTLALELRRRKARYGLATACIGGGQGIAMIIENEA